MQVKRCLGGDGSQGSQIRVNGVPLLIYVCVCINNCKKQAINKNKYNIVKYFVESGSTVRCMNNLKQTPIMIASKVGNINIGRNMSYVFMPSKYLSKVWSSG